MSVGLFVIGYSRPKYLEQCLSSLEANGWGGASYRGVILDYKDNATAAANRAVVDRFQVDYVYSGIANEGVAKTKNRALKKMMEHGCEHLFLMEDDIVMQDPNTCTKYHIYANMFGMHHANFAHHGPANVGREKTYMLKPGPLTCYPNCVGAFSYYSRQCIEKVGYIDEAFMNAWEHVEHTYRIIKEGMHPPFWYFIDYPASKKLLAEIPGSIDNSSIRPRADWNENIQKGQEYWIKKHGEWIPDFPHEDWSNITSTFYAQKPRP